MVKNLKLNFKNTQLSEALKIKKIKKPAAILKKANLKTKKVDSKNTEAKSTTLEEGPKKRKARIVSNEEQEATAKKKARIISNEEQEATAKKKADIISDEEQETTEEKKAEIVPDEKQETTEEKKETKEEIVAGEEQEAKVVSDKEQKTTEQKEKVTAPKVAEKATTTPIKKEVTEAKTTAKKEVTEEEAKKKRSGREFKDFKNVKKTEVRKSFDARDRQGLRTSEDDRWRKSRHFKNKRRRVNEDPVIRPSHLKIKLPILLKDLASEMKLKASELISKLFLQGVVVTLNDSMVDETIIQLLGHEFNCEISIDTSEQERLSITSKTIKEEIDEIKTEKLITRSPIITFMGHVDHGKTSLIDSIRKSNIASHEAGEITQHIGAFRAKTPSGDITILDTPGHEAFSDMRSRGANVTDIIVLVIGGDEGIRDQTIEAIEQAKKSNTPIVVAINKSDKENFDAEKVYRQLSDNNLLPEIWGGTTITVNCSATTNEGIPELLEMLSLQSEILELQANPDMRARGTILESEMHKGMGATATVLIQNGSLHVGDATVLGNDWGRIKTMHNELNKPITKAGPSIPVKITGLSNIAQAGDEFIVVGNEQEARSLAQGRSEKHRQRIHLQSTKGSLESLLTQTEEKKTLNLILKTDVQGSLEALKNSLFKIKSDKVQVNIINGQVGEVSESDIQLASASKAVIIGFHTQIESHAEFLIKQLKVEIKLFDIIYHIVDEVKKLMIARLDKIPEENDSGSAKILTIFKASHIGNIAGCQVTSGTIHRNDYVRVIRKDELIWKGKIASLKRIKEDVKEVTKGTECGIVFENFIEIEVDDVVQAYKITYHTQEL